MHFQRNYVLNRSPNVSTKFGEDRSNNKEMAIAFRNPRWRCDSSGIFLNFYYKHVSFQCITLCYMKLHLAALIGMVRA